mgnify:FL=1
MKRLEMRFENQAGRIVTFALAYPVAPIDYAAVNEAMDVVIEQNALGSNGGDLLKKHSARVVEQTIEDIDIYE